MIPFSAASQAARASSSTRVTPQDLCPSQQATLPCVWSPDQLQAPTFGAVNIDLGNGMTVDIVQVGASCTAARVNFTSMSCEHTQEVHTNKQIISRLPASCRALENQADDATCGGTHPLSHISAQKAMRGPLKGLVRYEDRSRCIAPLVWGRLIHHTQVYAVRDPMLPCAFAAS